MKHRRPTRSLLLFVVIATLVWNLWFLGKQMLSVGYYRPVLALEEESTFLIRKVPGYPALEFINKRLPESSRTLCIWTGAYGYYLNRPYYSDTFIEDVTFKGFVDPSTNEKDLSELKVSGFTHLFLRASLMEKGLTPHQAMIVNDFLENNAQQLFQYQDYKLIRVL